MFGGHLNAVNAVNAVTSIHNGPMKQYPKKREMPEEFKQLEELDKRERQVR